MGLVNSDVDIIRAVRCLCLAHKFQEALRLAHQLADEPSRNTLILICKSFASSQIQVKAA